jgi:hypothetical protein
MSNSFPTSIRLDAENKIFVRFFSAKKKISESFLVNQALALYRKWHLSREMMEEAQENPERDRAFSEEDFKSYHRLIHEAETI